MVDKRRFRVCVPVRTCGNNMVSHTISQLREPVLAFTISHSSASSGSMASSHQGRRK